MELYGLMKTSSSFTRMKIPYFEIFMNSRNSTLCTTAQAHYRIIATVIYLVLTTLGKGLAGVGRAENFVHTPKFDLARKSEGNQNTSYPQNTESSS